MLGWTFYRHFKNRIRLARSSGLAAMIAEFKLNTGKDVRLYLGAALVIVLITFPQWGRPLFAKTKNPCAPGSLSSGKNPCAPKNPCSASGNPCAASKNPCARK
jgi:hypothetical protein